MLAINYLYFSLKTYPCSALVWNAGCSHSFLCCQFNMYKSVQQSSFHRWLYPNGFLTFVRVVFSHDPGQQHDFRSQETDHEICLSARTVFCNVTRGLWWFAVFGPTTLHDPRILILWPRNAPCAFTLTPMTPSLFFKAKHTKNSVADTKAVKFTWTRKRRITRGTVWW